MLIYVISQMFCVFGLILYVLSMQMNEKKLILKFQTFSFSFYTIQYFMLGAYSGMLSYLINMIRSIIFFLFDNKRKYIKYLIILFVIISLIIGMYTYNEIFDVIPIINSVLSIFNISQKNINNIKKGQIVISYLWIIYDIKVYSYIAMLSELIVILSTIKGLKNTTKLLCEKFDSID